MHSFVATFSSRSLNFGVISVNKLSIDSPEGFIARCCRVEIEEVMECQYLVQLPHENLYISSRIPV